MSDEWLDEELRNAFAEVRLPTDRLARMVRQANRHQRFQTGWLVALAAVGVLSLAVWQGSAAWTWLQSSHPAAPSPLPLTPAPLPPSLAPSPSPAPESLPPPPVLPRMEIREADLAGRWQGATDQGGSMTIETISLREATLSSGGSATLELTLIRSDGEVSTLQMAVFLSRMSFFKPGDPSLHAVLSDDGERIEGRYTISGEKGRFSSRRDGHSPVPQQPKPPLDPSDVLQPANATNAGKQSPPRPPLPSSLPSPASVGGLWVGSTDTSRSLKLTVLHQEGEHIEGTVELQTADGTFRSFPFAGRANGEGILSFEGTTTNGVRVRFTGTRNNRKISGSYETDDGQRNGWTLYKL